LCIDLVYLDRGKARRTLRKLFHGVQDERLVAAAKAQLLQAGVGDVVVDPISGVCICTGVLQRSLDVMFTCPGACNCAEAPPESNRCLNL